MASNVAVIEAIALDIRFGPSTNHRTASTSHHLSGHGKESPLSSCRHTTLSHCRRVRYGVGDGLMTHAIIFDMDGVLVDSEPLWRRAEQHVFAQQHIGLTDEMCAQTMGWRLDEVVVHWLTRYHRPLEHATAIETDVVDTLCDLLRREAQPLPGAIAAIELARRRHERVALASSSAQRIIDTVLVTLGLTDAFDAVCSAQFEAHGKPHPAVYMRAATVVGVPPPACVAIEDSVPGLISACAARMRTIAVPQDHTADDPRYVLADLRLTSLAKLDAAHLDALRR